MRTTLLIFLLPLFCFAQNVITDDFTDGDFSQNPMWEGDTGNFEVSASFELQLKDTAAGEAYLSTVSEIIGNASWEFYLRMEFNPSSSNFAKVYLVSNSTDLSGNLNGYYVRLGGSSADRISLYRQDGNSSTLIVESADDWLDLNLVEVWVKVTRDSTGFWRLSADTADGTNYTPIDSATDATHSSSAYFGIRCEYTSTRSDKFFFDDFSLSGDMFVDDQAAEVISLEILDSVSLMLEFSEPMDSASANDIANYQVSGTIGLPVKAVLNSMNSTQVELDFSSVIQINTPYHLYLNGVKDLFGNITNDTLSFMRYEPLRNQLIITELMVDPSPVVGVPPNALPEREYIEIYNQSSLSINLKDWELWVGSSIEILPDHKLMPGGYLVITHEDGVSEFPAGVPVLGTGISSTALSNSGTTVSLVSPKGLAINSVSYTDDWYGDPNKENGGWSLELIDTGNVCGGAQNWAASRSSLGGTPGQTNSVAGNNPDTTKPIVNRVAIIGDSTIAVYFSESVDEALLSDTSNISVFPALKIESVSPAFPDARSVEIQFVEKIKEETLYQLWFNELPQDCAGNYLQNDSLIFAIPSTPEAGEVILNEILFNPYSQGSDFVELYNYSNKVFDLNKLLLGNWNSTTQSIENPEPISNESYLFGPGEYVAISSDIEFLKGNYRVKNPKALLKSDAVPSMDDTEGSIAVVTSDLNTVCDYLEYTDDMHLAVLQSDEGVSLERINFAKATQENDNWHSAAEGAGFATPGYINSMAYQMISKGKVSLDPKVFSPNQDGYNDILKINYVFQNAGNVVSLSIWNSSGVLVRQLQENTNVGQEGFFTWDGTNENAQLLNSGIYIVVFEYFNESGTKEIFKETCVLSL